MQERLDKLYDEITDIENAIEEVETRLYNIRQDKISEDNVYQFLLFFDKLYDKFTDLEKKTFLKSFLSDVFIYEEEQKDGRILKGLRFKFSIYMNGRNVLGVDRDNESTDETVVALHHQRPTVGSQNNATVSNSRTAAAAFVDRREDLRYRLFSTNNDRRTPAKYKAIFKAS